MRHFAEEAPRQQFERSVGRFIGIADRLAILDLVEKARDARIVLVDGKPDALEFGQHVGAARLIGHQKLSFIADAFRRDVLVGRRLLDDRGGMDAGFGGECALADIGRVAVRGAVEQFVERVRDAGEMRQRCRPTRRYRIVGVFLLQLQRRDDGDEIGVAAALAEPVERALDLARAGAHRGEGIRHRLLGVVMGMDADMIAGNLRADLADDALDLMRQRAAIGVAQHHPARALLVGRLGAGEREKRAWPCSRRRNARSRTALRGLWPWRRARIADHGDVLLFRRLQRDAT